MIEIPKKFIGMVIILLLWASFTYAEESLPAAQIIPKKPAKTFYDLPRDQVQEYRALQAEERALRAEASMSLKEIDLRREELLEKWRKLTGEKDLSRWQVNFEKNQLTRNGKEP